MSLVELYYSDTCADCHHVRSMIMELLPRGVKFKEVNAQQGEGAAKAAELGIMSVPTIVIDGDVILEGRVDREEIRAALKGLS